MSQDVMASEAITQWSTEKLKQELLKRTATKDTEPLKQKVDLAKELAPLFAELSRRNPYPDPKEQIPLVLGVWMPVWSTIPFQDTVPGRVRDQSYQIFHDDGYYANVARYAPGHRIPWLQKLSSLLFSYDFMILQRFGVVDEQWSIQNIGIKQSLRASAIPLSIDAADRWFTTAVQSLPQSPDASIAPSFKKGDRKTAKRYQKIFQATPQLEHLYIDPEFRLVKTRREASQRFSYTIAVRLR